MHERVTALAIAACAGWTPSTTDSEKIGETLRATGRDETAQDEPRASDGAQGTSTGGEAVALGEGYSAAATAALASDASSVALASDARGDVRVGDMIGGRGAACDRDRRAQPDAQRLRSTHGVVEIHTNVSGLGFFFYLGGRGGPGALWWTYLV